jgi:hypothetical protein
MTQQQPIRRLPPRVTELDRAGEQSEVVKKIRETVARASPGHQLA